MLPSEVKVGEITLKLLHDKLKAVILANNV